VLHSASFHIAVGQETDQSVKLGVVGEKSRCDDPERGAEPADVTLCSAKLPQLSVCPDGERIIVVCDPSVNAF
jgi:hypothetical protein